MTRAKLLRADSARTKIPAVSSLLPLGTIAVRVING